MLAWRQRKRSKPFRKQGLQRSPAGIDISCKGHTLWGPVAKLHLLRPTRTQMPNCLEILTWHTSWQHRILHLHPRPDPRRVQTKAVQRSAIPNLGQKNDGKRLTVVREAAIYHIKKVCDEKELARNAWRSPTYLTRYRTLSLWSFRRRWF